MKSNYISFQKALFYVLISIICFTNISFASDESDIIEVLDIYYQASVDEDIEKYMGVIDKDYYEYIMPEGEDWNYEDYVLGVFSEISTLSYELENKSVVIMDENTALVFYILISEVEHKETSEKVSINNDMVTFLYKYDNEWKIRWSITRVMYEAKLYADTFNTAVMFMTMDEMNEKSLKEEAIELGVLKISDEDIMDNDDTNIKLKNNYVVPDDDYLETNGIDGIENIDNEKSNFNQKEYEEYYKKHYSNQDEDSNWLGWLGLALLVIFLLWFAFWPKKKNKKNNNSGNKQNLKKDKLIDNNSVNDNIDRNELSNKESNESKNKSAKLDNDNKNNNNQENKDETFHNVLKVNGKDKK